MAIRNSKARSYSYLTNQIRNLAGILQDNELYTTIQWVPSHVDIPHNEYVDGLAKQAHNLPEETAIPLDQKEMKKLMRSTLQKNCQLQYETEHRLHIAGIKSSFVRWPWASSQNRKTETAMARLRIGHTKLNANLHRFHQADNPNCQTCQVEETPKHVLEACRTYEYERLILHQTLYRLGVRRPNMKTLLGGGTYDVATQEKIRTAVEVFLMSSGAIDHI